MFYILFVLAFYPVIYVLLKIMKHKDFFVFDALIIFSALYFWIIPCKDFLFTHEFPEFLDRTQTSLALFVYMWSLMVADYIFSIYKQGKNALNISRYFLKFKLYSKPALLWVILLAGLVYLYQITNYSSLTEENVEANNQFQYGNNMPLLLRFFALSIRTMYPLFLITLYEFRATTLKYKRLRIACFCVLIAALILGVKTFLVFNILFFLIYLYSTRKESVKTKHLIYTGVGILLIFVLLFPILQGFRVYKQYSIENMSVHDFFSVASGYIENGVDEKMEESVERYQDRRTMNVYSAFDWACNERYRGDGLMTWLIFRYLIPQRSIDNKGNIMGDMMQGKGADIGESCVAWFVFDYGCVIGPMFCVIYFIILFYLLYLFGYFINLIFNNSSINYIVLVIMAQFAINIEHNPSVDIKAFYSAYIIIFIFIGLIYKWFEKKRINVSNYA